MTPAGILYFGEYFANPDRDAVHVFASYDSGDTWEPAYTFAAGSIRHVHGIFHDPYRDGQWVLTGDDDEECRILFTDDDFRTLDVVFAGSQQARAVTVFPTQERLIIGTDTPLEQNYIQELDPETGEIHRLQAVQGSIFYGCRAGEYRVFSVVSEPSRVNTSPFASIRISRDGSDWRELYRRRRDLLAPRYGPWPDSVAEMSLFQYAAFHLPQGACDRNLLYAYGQSVSGDDDCTLCWDLDAAWDQPEGRESG